MEYLITKWFIKNPEDTISGWYFDSMTPYDVLNKRHSNISLKNWKTASLDYNLGQEARKKLLRLSPCSPASLWEFKRRDYFTYKACRIKALRKNKCLRLHAGYCKRDSRKRWICFIKSKKLNCQNTVALEAARSFSIYLPSI